MLFHQEMNSEVNGSVQEQTSGKGVPPSSVGAGGPRARTTGLSQAQPPAPLPKAEAAYLLCSLGPPRLTLPTPPAPSEPASSPWATLDPGQPGRPSPPLGTSMVEQSHRGLGVLVLSS